jgi:hypothetical protein
VKEGEDTVKEEFNSTAFVQISTDLGRGKKELGQSFSRG